MYHSCSCFQLFWLAFIFTFLNNIIPPCVFTYFICWYGRCHLLLDPTLAHFFSTMISRFVIKFFAQIQAHQEMHEFGHHVVLLISALSCPICSFCFLPSSCWYHEGLRAYGGRLSPAYTQGFGVLEKPSFIVNGHGLGVGVVI